MHNSLFLNISPFRLSRNLLGRGGLLAVILFCFSAACTTTTSSQNPSDLDKAKLNGTGVATISNNQTTDYFMNALKLRHYSDSASKFDSKVKQALSPDALGRLWDAQIAQLGPLVRWHTIQKTLRDGYEINIVPIEFEKGQLKMTLTISSATGEIAGIFFAPETMESATPKKKVSFLSKK